MHTRRQLIQAALASTLGPWATLSVAASPAAAESNRFVMLVLRGGMDGLTAVPATGDPSFADARGVLGQFPSDPLLLDRTFALHPLLPQLHAMYGQGELAVLHAVGLPYRERSHFDAQQVLESGGTRPFELDTGWLARALASDARRGIALNTAVPLVLRGPGEIDTWAPSAGPEPTGDLIARLERLYRDDRVLGPALARARGLRQEADMPLGPMGRPMAGPMAAPNAPAGGEMTAAGTMAPAGGPAGPAGAAGRPAVALARRAAEFLVRPGGPQAAVLELGGWDTHANQAAPNGALANGLRTLDASLGAIRDVLGAPEAHGAWGRTVVVVVTEFGRQVAANGTMGTDHGSGGAAFVLGGAVAGSRVLADWPGLAARDRYEGRDLRTTTDLRAVFRSVLGDHLGVSTAALDRQVFPGTTSALRLDLLRG